MPAANIDGALGNVRQGCINVLWIWKPMAAASISVSPVILNGITRVTVAALSTGATASHANDAEKPMAMLDIANKATKLTASFFITPYLLLKEKNRINISVMAPPDTRGRPSS